CEEPEYAAMALCRVIGRLVRPRDEGILPLLLQCLTARHEQVRVAVIEALGIIGTPIVLPVLLRHCLTSEKPVALAAALALGKTADEATMRRLKDFLSVGDRRAAAMACEALVAIGPRAVPMLIKAAKNK